MISFYNFLNIKKEGNDNDNNHCIRIYHYGKLQLIKRLDQAFCVNSLKSASVLERGLRHI